jgi:hypothetical protein
MLRGNVQKRQNNKNCIKFTLKWLELEQSLLDVKTFYDENLLHIQEAANKQWQGLLESLISITQFLPSHNLSFKEPSRSRNYGSFFVLIFGKSFI